jgi:hypothetical protein
MRQRRTLRERIETRIARRQGEDVFLPREFRDLGGKDQVLRVLRGLVREKRLVRLGYEGEMRGNAGKCGDGLICVACF